MASSYEILAQSNPSAATLTTAFTVGVGEQMIVSTITVCNRSSTATTFRIALSPGGAGISNEQYIYYDVPINGNDTFQCTAGITLNDGDIVRVYATLATLSFNFSGTVIT